MWRFIVFVVSVILFIVGVPGLLSDLDVWGEWMRDAEWWNWLFMATGLVLFLYTLITWRSKAFLDAARRLFSMSYWKPTWEVEAKDRASFKLFEVACIFEGSSPEWPLPSDESEIRYEDIVEVIAKAVRPSAFKEWSGAVHEFEIDRRSIRKYFSKSRHDSFDVRLPWFFREKFDNVLPPGIDERDVRQFYAGSRDE